MPYLGGILEVGTNLTRQWRSLMLASLTTALSSGRSTSSRYCQSMRFPRRILGKASMSMLFRQPCDNQHYATPCWSHHSQTSVRWHTSTTSQFSIALHRQHRQYTVSYVWTHGSMPTAEYQDGIVPLNHQSTGHLESLQFERCIKTSHPTAITIGWTRLRLWRATHEDSGLLSVK